MKVLQDLRSHVDNLMGQRLKGRVAPKAVSVESVTMEPKPGAIEGSPLEEKQESPMERMSESDPMADDDKKRLLDLYSQLK